MLRVERITLHGNGIAQEAYQVMKIAVKVGMSEYEGNAKAPAQDVEMDDQFATGGGEDEDEDEDVEMEDVGATEVQDVEMGLEN